MVETKRGFQYEPVNIYIYIYIYIYITYIYKRIGTSENSR